MHLKGFGAGVQGRAVDPMQAWYLANKTSMGVPGGMHLGAAATDPSAVEAAATATASQGTWWQDPFQAFGPAGVLHQALSAGAFNAEQAMSTPALPSNFSGSAATMMQLATSEGGATASAGARAIKVGKPAAVKATPKTAASILMKLSRTNTRKTKSKHKRRDRDRDRDRGHD